MKIAVRIIQVLVGVLFIFSGLIKAIDPLGLAYKMEEFFQLWNTSLAEGHFFAKTLLIAFLKFWNDHSLFLAVFMITLEIATGVALLVGWMKRFVLTLLLILIIFFAFLTGYAYLSGKFTNCGCFGDCLPITPLTSFTKDIVLLVMILFLIVGQRYIFSISSQAFRSAIVIASLALSLFLQWYVLNYLPLIDCLPMKKGNNIADQMKPPKNAVPSVYETRLVYENIKTGQLKDMSQEEYNNSKIWEDSSWKWKETKTKLIKQGTDAPKLTNFSLTTVNGTDTTEASLSDSNYLVLYYVNPSSTNSKLIDENFLKTVSNKGIQTFFVTTNREDFDTAKQNDVFTCDGTVFRIAARVNPTIYLLKQGTIINKWPLKKIGEATTFINELKK